MLTRLHGVDYSDLESRLQNGAPGERDAATGARVRGRVVHQRSKGSFVRVGFVAAVVVTIVVAALAWSGESRIAPSAAFAYDQVAQVLTPEDGVLHAKFSMLETPIQPTMILKDANDNTVTVEYPTEDPTAWTELWIDVSRQTTRQQDGGGMFPASSFLVVGPDRTRLETGSGSQDHRVEEYLTENHAGDDMWQINSMRRSWLGLGLGLTPSFSEELESRSCEVTEGVAPDGTEVWRVTWEEEPEPQLPEDVVAGFDAETRAAYEDQLLNAPVSTCVALFRRSDYRPLSVDIHRQYPSGREPGMIPSNTDTHIEIEVWEVLPADEVPAGLLETRSDLGDAAASYAVDMTPDDPRIVEIGFPVWKAGDDLGLGPISSARFCQGDAIMSARPMTSSDLERSGMLTVFYGDADPWALSPDLVGITAFVSSDSGDVEEYWAAQMSDVEETTGEVDGRSYRMRSSDGKAVLLTTIDDQIVVISGPDEDTILGVLGALEPWE